MLLDQWLAVGGLQLGHDLPHLAPRSRPSSECCTHTTERHGPRARSTRLADRGHHVIRWWAPSTTPFCTSITRRAVFGRFGRVVMRIDVRPAHEAPGRGAPDSHEPRPDRRGEGARPEIVGVGGRVRTDLIEGLQHARPPRHVDA